MTRTPSVGQRLDQLDTATRATLRALEASAIACGDTFATGQILEASRIAHSSVQALRQIADRLGHA